jgi:hypothetical protein
MNDNSRVTGDGGRPFSLIIDPRFCGGILSDSNGNKLR